MPEAFKVTPAILGVHRPSQHIDNPKVENPKPQNIGTIDNDFEPWIESGSPWLEVDPERSMKRFIYRSVATMQEELGAAMTAGHSLHGCRLFGAGLHILEDFFAHSNFVELSLIKQGYNTVLPWTSQTSCKWKLPLVTGRFGASDFIASVALPISKIITPIEIWKFSPTKPGFRSDSEQLILILLSEQSNQYPLRTFETYLSLRDDLASDPLFARYELALWLVSAPARLLANTLGTTLQNLSRWVSNTVDDLQTRFDDNPNTSGSTDPTHSQLAKDHVEHPFHELAAQLAEAATKSVGEAMKNHWVGIPGPNPMAVATAFFAHPQDSDWQDQIVARWAKENPELIALGSSAIRMEGLHRKWLDAMKRERAGMLDTGPDFLEEVQKYIDFYRNNNFTDLGDLEGLGGWSV